MARFTDDELERYARHIALREIGGAGQARLKESRALVVGAGALGGPAAMYLAAAGMGRLRIVDDDTVSLSNLQRQVIHATGRVGRRKVDSAREALGAINPHVAVETEAARLNPDNAAALLEGVDVALDCTDDATSRRALNAACVASGTPLVSAAIGQWEGQLAVFAPGAACYACVFPKDVAPGLAPSCAEGGVLGALAGVMGAMQAAEAVKVLLGLSGALSGRMLLYDALSAEIRVIRTRPRPGCPICGGGVVSSA